MVMAIGMSIDTVYPKIPARIWKALVRRIRTALTRLFTVQIQKICRLDIDPNACNQPRWENGWVCRVLHPKNEEAIAQIEQMNSWRKGELWERIAAGNVCVAALCDGKVVGFNLVTFGEVCIEKIHLRRFFRPEEAWVEQMTVRPEVHHQGLGMSLHQVLPEVLRQRGVPRLYAGSSRSNQAAHRLARRAGFREVADIHYVHFFGLKTWHCVRVPRSGRQPSFQDVRPRLLPQP
jgi:GNAT superfamily N-acetyltransferase